MGATAQVLGPPRHRIRHKERGRVKREQIALTRQPGSQPPLSLASLWSQFHLPSTLLFSLPLRQHPNFELSWFFRGIKPQLMKARVVLRKAGQWHPSLSCCGILRKPLHVHGSNLSGSNLPYTVWQEPPCIMALWFCTYCWR